jgi:hypothetical protein
MGYSFDSSADAEVVNNQTIDASVSSSAGTHTLHVKAFGDQGASCVTDVVITVKAGAAIAEAALADSSAASVIPSNAQTVSNIEALGGWAHAHDSGGPGSSSGSTSTVSSPALYGSSRKFAISFSGNGDERYSVAFSDDVNTKNYFYDVWLYLDSSAGKIANLEMDTNPVMPNGKTVLIGIQCDGWSNHWAYTVNTGSASHVKPKWVSKSGTSCNPANWTRNKWHHVQASFSRDDSGYITYHSIWLDGNQSSLNVKVFGAASLGWGPVINTQFQIDGLGSGSAKVYADNLAISRW